MIETFDRLDVSDLTMDRLAPLESLMTPEWPDLWRELATSHYITLISAPGAENVPPSSLARLAVALTAGIAQDLGGTQPYIPVGAEMMNGTRMRRVTDLLSQGRSYKEVAAAVGLTVVRVRGIERAWRREQIALRQGSLSFD